MPDDLKISGVDDVSAGHGPETPAERPARELSGRRGVARILSEGSDINSVVNSQQTSAGRQGNVQPHAPRASGDGSGHATTVRGDERQGAPAPDGFYCPEHRYNPPENSGFCFCPFCEVL